MARSLGLQVGLYHLDIQDLLGSEDEANISEYTDTVRRELAEYVRATGRFIAAPAPPSSLWPLFSHLEFMYNRVKLPVRSPPTWASTWQNLSSGFPTKWDSNQLAQLQRLARKLKFAHREPRYDTFQKANNKGADQTARMRRLVCACVVCKPPKTGFLATRSIWERPTSENLVPLTPWLVENS